MPRVFVLAIALVLGTTATASQGPPRDDAAQALAQLERQSHELWLKGDQAALAELMADSFRFVAMNGAVETKADVTGPVSPPAKPRPLKVEHLEVEPDEVMLLGDTAIVLGLMRIRASVADRVLPERMRVLSVYMREDAGAPWRLTARSITPLLAPPGAGQNK